jgi:hypothetical protein
MSELTEKERETALDKSLKNVANNHSSIMENFIETFLSTKLEERIKTDGEVLDKVSFLRNVFDSCELCFSEPEYDTVTNKMNFRCWIQPKASKNDGLQPTNNSSTKNN